MQFLLKKWVIFISVVIIIVLLEGFHILHYIQSYQAKENNTAIKKARAAVSLSSIQSVRSFHGKVAYHVIAAKDQSDHHVFVWVPDQKGQGKVFMERANLGISKQTVLQKMKSQFPYKKIFTVDLGVKDNQPVWAVSYLNKDHHYSVTYFDFFTGEDMTIMIT